MRELKSKKPVPLSFQKLIAAHGKSPWNPSASAKKRVPNPVQVPQLHDCGNPVEIAHHRQVYRKEYGEWPWMYRCTHCDARVGMHPFTDIPLGTLAGKKLRELRTNCKPVFERLWQKGPLTRKEAYAALAKHLNIELDACHFALFDETQCLEAKTWAVAFLKQSG